MADKNFSFVPKNIRDAGSFRDKAISFKYHISFNLNDGDEIAFYSEYAAIKRCNTGKIGLYSADNGIPILADVYDTIEIKHTDYRAKQYAEHKLENHFFEVSVGDCYGVYSKYGLQLVPIKYKKGIVLFDECFIVTFTENGLKGVYDSKGRLIVPVEYESISIRYGIIIASKTKKNERKEYAFNKYGHTILHEMFDSDKPKGYDNITIYDNCIITRENGTCEIYSKEGRQILIKKMKSIIVESGYIIAVDQSGKYGAYTLDGKTLVMHEYDKLTKFGKGYIKGKYGKSECLFYKDGYNVIRRGIYQKITETKYGARAVTFDGRIDDYELRMHIAIEL